MKLVKQGLSLALLGAGLVAIPGLQATAAAPAPQVSGESVVQKIKREAEGSVAVSREPATGKIGFVRAARGGDLMPSVKADSLAGAVNKAGAYLARYSTALGARAGELKQSRVTTSRYGWTVSYDPALPRGAGLRRHDPGEHRQGRRPDLGQRLRRPRSRPQRHPAPQRSPGRRARDRHRAGQPAGR